MAQANRESGDHKKTQGTGDFSLVQAGSVDSILKDTSWPKQDDISYAGSQSDRSVPAEESIENNQIYASHYALSTAYARVTKKLAEAEQRNQQLVMQDSLRGQDSFRSGKMSGAAGSQTNFAMPPDMEASINQAWEAYNEKCKECQQLREELEQVKQRSNNAEHFSRLKNLQDDVLREKAKQDDVVRKLEKTKMEAGHLEKKEILAREELEKEREYQRSILQIAERKHWEMEEKIEELERNLASEKSLTEDLRKRERSRQKVLEDEFVVKKEMYITKIKELEERNMHLKEEVSVLVSMQSSNINGPTTSTAQMNGVIDSTQAASSGKFESEKDVTALEIDIQTLQMELTDLKTRAADQCSILSAVLQNPKIVTLLGSTDFLQSSIAENTGLLPSLKKCNSSEVVHKRKKSNSLRARNHASPVYTDGVHSVNSSTSSLGDIYGSSTTNSEQLPNARQIPPKYSEDASSSSVPVMKHAEDIIRVISKEGTIQNRKSEKSPLRNENLFPPMNVSRVIHTPESSGPRTMPATNRGSTSENFSDDFNPMATSPPFVKYNGTGPAVSTTPQSSPFSNENVTANIRPLANGQPPLSHMQTSLPTMEIESNQFYSAISTNSLSSTDTLTSSPVDETPSIRPTNPFYKDLTGRSSLQHSINRNQVPMEQNTNRSNKQVLPIPKNLMDLDNDIAHSLRPAQAASVNGTPGNRYIPVHSSDEDSGSDSGSFQQISPEESITHQPREFVVPKVVRAEDLAVQGALSRKAFQDSGYTAPPAQQQTRPAMRAKSEPTTTNPAPSGARTTWPENNEGVAATPHQYPTSSNRTTKRNQEDGTKCPICDFSFSSDWTEEKMSRHINGHFSDEDNNVLSFD